MSASEKQSWCLTHGIVMATGQFVDAGNMLPIIRHAPIAIDPFLFPKKSFQKAIDLAPIFNDLMNIVSRDDKWLLETLHLIPESDLFTRQLIKIYKAITTKEVTSWHQSITLAINRSDYMQHQVENDSRDLLQVEINTIASSFGALSTKLSNMHQAFNKMHRIPCDIPANNAIKGISNAIHTAHDRFLEQIQKTNGDAITIIVVQPNEKNFSDQMLIQFELLETFGVQMIRASLTDLHNKSRLDESSGLLFFGDKIVSVIYFRAGYT
jgi:glutathione synthase